MAFDRIPIGEFSLIHKGSYNKLHEAWSRIGAYAKEKSLSQTDQRSEYCQRGGTPCRAPDPGLHGSPKKWLFIENGRWRIFFLPADRIVKGESSYILNLTGTIRTRGSVFIPAVTL